jgi:hypothetical protein
MTQQQENGIHLIRNLIMPSKSKAQHKRMQAVAHSPEFAKKVGMLQSVNKDFVEADKKAHKFQSKKK